MKVRVTVVLKDGVLDPQGKAIGHALSTLGFSGLGDVRCGKVIDIEVAQTDAQAAREEATRMAHALLANEVIEDFTAEVLA